MGFLPDFSLPSNPKITIRLREATVSDAIDFSDIDEHHDEEVITLFLERVQDKALYSDPRDWTGPDRRFAIYWYGLHTMSDIEVPLSFPCPLCGEEHTVLIDLRRIANEYVSLAGKPERDIVFNGEPIVVHPLRGRDLEAIERMRLVYADAVDAHGEGSAQARVAMARIKVSQFMLSLQFPNAKDEHDKYREQKIEETPFSEYEKLVSLVQKELIAMQHGLNIETKDGKTSLITYPVSCVNNPGKEGPRLRMTFRSDEYIPTLW